MADENKQEPPEIKKLSKKHEQVMTAYLDPESPTRWSQYKSYMTAYPKCRPESARTLSAKLFADVHFSSNLNARLQEYHMGVNEALAVQASFARADMGVFFKQAEIWTPDARETDEILQEEERAAPNDSDPDKTVTWYLVRRVAVDMDKVTDPQYSHLLHKFTDSPTKGLSIETYDKQGAVRDVLKIHGKYKETGETAVTVPITVVEVVRPDDGK